MAIPPRAPAGRSLPEWLAWMEAHHPRQIELGLDRVGAVAQRLGLPLSRQPGRPLVFTIGGTNGKGSCVAVLEAVLRAQGRRVGAYTSPHLLHYNERVRLNGSMATDAQLCDAFAAVFAALDGTSLTYFEFGTLAALWLFERERLDAWILEVGLGGRLDAVNLVDSDAAAVISVDLDHLDWLGNDRDTIGYEKAGIFRRDCPAICADPAPPASLLAIARERGARWLPVGSAYDFTVQHDTWSWRGAELPGHPQLTDLPLPVLPLPSAAAALALLHAVPAATPGGDAIRAGLAAARLPGRFQTLQVGAVEVVLDVGHNPHAARWLRAGLQAPHATGSARPTRAVFAVMADKAWGEIISTLAPAVTDWYVGDLVDVPRAAPAATVATALREQGACVHEAASLVAAWRTALADAGTGERVVVFGSFFTVAAILAELDGAAAGLEQMDGAQRAPLPLRGQGE